MALSAKQITGKRGDRLLFNKLSFFLHEGQLLVVRGSNGSGKTTLLKTLSGLLEPFKGTLEWKGISIREGSDYTQNISYLAHKNGLRRGLTVFENLCYLARLKGQIGSIEHALELLQAFNLKAHAHQECGKLSAGQQRKVALCAVLLQKPPLWILDEPFTSLDCTSIDTLLCYIKAHLAKQGMVIMTAHHALPLDPHHTIHLDPA